MGQVNGKKLLQRIAELEAFENLLLIPSNLPFRREKLINNKDIWAIRINQEYRIIFKAVKPNEDLRLIKSIEILEVSKHYE